MLTDEFYIPMYLHIKAKVDYKMIKVKIKSHYLIPAPP